jgi:hypothetical protein
MYDVREELLEIVEETKQLHTRERSITLESVSLIGELERRNAAVNLSMTSEQFAVHIGLTPNQYWKRAQAARLIRFHPEAQKLLESGETQVSHLALIAPKITQANSELLLDGIKHKSKREVALLLSRITAEGDLLPAEATFELRVTLTKSQGELLDRAREVLANMRGGGRMPSLPEILVKALEDLLDKRDPLKKAERAKARAANSPSSGKEASDEVEAEADTVSNLASPGNGDQSPTKKSPSRPAIPAAIRHTVWLRDRGQCTWVHPGGSRCPERGMLELDHIKMWCRGGDHSEDNLTLRCRRHNQVAAEQELGTGFMAQARKRAAGAASLAI